MARKKMSKEEPLFAVEELDFAPPPSPLEQEEKKRRAKERERARATVRTQDESAMTTDQIMAQWVEHAKASGLSETQIPVEIRLRVGRSLRSLIKKGYVYEEIVFALKNFTIKDLRDRKYTPKTGNLEIYARQYRGENTDEREANDAERERLRSEALSQGRVPSSGTARQNQRDASFAALVQASRERQARSAGAGRQIAPQAPRQIEGGRSDGQ